MDGFKKTDVFKSRFNPSFSADMQEVCISFRKGGNVACFDGRGCYDVRGSDARAEQPNRHVVEGGDHSFAVLKRSGRDPLDVLEEIGQAVSTWADSAL